MIIGYLKTYHKEFVVASFMGIQGLQDEIEKEKKQYGKYNSTEHGQD